MTPFKQSCNSSSAAIMNYWGHWGSLKAGHPALRCQFIHAWLDVIGVSQSLGHPLQLPPAFTPLQNPCYRCAYPEGTQSVVVFFILYTHPFTPLQNPCYRCASVVKTLFVPPLIYIYTSGVPNKLTPPIVTNYIFPNLCLFVVKKPHLYSKITKYPRSINYYSHLQYTPPMPFYKNYLRNRVTCHKSTFF